MLVQFDYIYLYLYVSTHVKRCASNTACTKLSKRKLERDRVVQMRRLLSEGSVLDTFVYYSYSVLLPEYTRVYPIEYEYCQCAARCVFFALLL